MTRLAEAGCTEAEIVTITGLTLASVHNILEHHLARTDKLAVAAIKRDVKRLSGLCPIR